MKKKNSNFSKNLITVLMVAVLYAIVSFMVFSGKASRQLSNMLIPISAYIVMAVSLNLVVGLLGGRRVICMQGRLHYYEGHSMRQIIFPVRVFARLGVGRLIVTNAAGGINRDFAVGDIMLIDDHINLQGTNPLIGPNDDEFGERFCDMTFVYDPEMKEAALRAAEKAGVPLRRGVYIAVTGPSYETPAEFRAFRALGADAVGMSTVPEVIAASHAGMKVLGFSLITNMAAGILQVRLSGDEVIAVGERQSKVLVGLVRAVVEAL